MCYHLQIKWLDSSINFSCKLPILWQYPLSFVKKHWKHWENKTYPLTYFISASSKNNVIAICSIVLTILQSLVGFNQPSTTQSTKPLRNDLVFVKTSKFESKKYISLRNFHEQQIFQLKTTITHSNERDSLFQIQNFVLSVQFNNKNHI